MKKESSRTPQQQGNPTADEEEPEARLGQDFIPSSTAAVNGAARAKILLCLSGSVAVVKAPQLAVKLSEFAEVRV